MGWPIVVRSRWRPMGTGAPIGDCLMTQDGRLGHHIINTYISEARKRRFHRHKSPSRRFWVSPRVTKPAEVDP